MKRRVLVLAPLALAAGCAPALADEAEAWAALGRGGHVLLMRHAQTDAGTGDPPGFRLDDCSTQRNLDERGRRQARAWGEAVRARGLAFDRVLSSAWCRCLETAELMGVGPPVERFEPLYSFFEDRGRAEAQTRELRAFVAGWRGPGNALLVSHQVNVTALTGVFPRPAEAVVLAAAGEGFRNLGGLSPPTG